MARLTWVALGLVLGGCQSSYLARRGDLARARGDRLQAIADYEQVIQNATAAEAEPLSIEQETIVREWVDQRLAEIEADPSRTDELLSLASTPWVRGEARARVLDATVRSGLKKRPEIEALAAQGHYVPALREARKWSDASTSLAAWARELGAAGQRAHLEQAAKATPSVAAFHRRLANLLGPESAPEPPPLAVDPRGVLELQLSAECAGLGPALEAKLGAPTGPKLRIALEHCEKKEDRQRTVERYDAIIQVPRVVTATTWIEIDGVVSARRTPIETLEPTTVTKRRDVLTRTLRVTAVGALMIEGGRSSPLDAERTHQDRAFWTPEASEKWAPVDLDRLEAEALDKIVAEVKSAWLEVARSEATATAHAASERGDWATAEASWISASTLGAGWPPEASAYFQETYGLSPQESWALASGGAIAIASSRAPIALPSAEIDGDEESYESSRARDADPKGDHRWQAANGLDLYTDLTAAPVAGHPLALGLGLRSRVGHVHLEVRGASRAVGGDVEGGKISLLGWSGEDDNDTEELFRWSFGLAYEAWRGSDDARYLGIGFPVAISLQPLDPLVIEAGVFLNCAQIKDLVDEDPTDPRHHSPLHLAATLGLRHFYVRGTVLYDLGASDGPRGALEIGARL